MIIAHYVVLGKLQPCVPSKILPSIELHHDRGSKWDGGAAGIVNFRIGHPASITIKQLTADAQWTTPPTPPTQRKLENKTNNRDALTGHRSSPALHLTAQNARPTQERQHDCTRSDVGQLMELARIPQLHGNHLLHPFPEHKGCTAPGYVLQSHLKTFPRDSDAQTQLTGWTGPVHALGPQTCKL